MPPALSAARRRSAGLTTQAQTFDPRKWQTNEDWGGIQQFRNRAYDPATGTWIQEDPMGVAGGVNLYRFNNGNPVSFGDPFGLCPPKDNDWTTCAGFFTLVGEATGALVGGVMGGTGGAAGGATLCAATVVGSVPCAVAGGAAGAVAGSSRGAAIGGTIGGVIDVAVVLAKKIDIRQVDQAIREALGRKPSELERRQFRDYIHQEKDGGLTSNSKTS